MNCTTRPLVRIASNVEIQLDLHQFISKAVVNGAVGLTDILKAQPQFKKYHEQFDDMHIMMTSEIVQFLVGQVDTKTPQASHLSHLLNFYALMPDVGAIMALTISPLMASATGGECSFSVYNEVHAKKHNRL
eukprot:239110-Ditylum_brightwellii.AAC.1